MRQQYTRNRRLLSSAAAKDATAAASSLYGLGVAAKSGIIAKIRAQSESAQT
jgi:hypothetical protein